MGRADQPPADRPGRVRVTSDRSASASLLDPSDRHRACTPAQRWLWNLDAALGPSSQYNVFDAVEVAGPLDVARLERSFAALVERHEMLRTVFRSSDGEPVACLTSRTADVETRTTSSLPEARELAEQLVTVPFALDRDLPVRLWWIVAGHESGLIVLCVHHIAADAASLGVMWRELGVLYDGGSPGPAPVPPEIAVDEDLLAEQRGFWRERLAGLELLELPSDRPRPARWSGHGAQVPVVMSPALTHALAAAARTRRSTLFPFLLAAVHVVLSRWSGAADIAIGTVVSGRFEQALEGVVGYYVNTVVVRTGHGPGDTVGTLVDRVQDELLDVYSNADVEFAELATGLGVARDPSRNPFFDVMVTLQDAASTTFAPTGLRVSGVTLRTTTSKFDVSVMFVGDGEALTAELAYATDLFDAETAERLAAQIATALAAVVDDDATPVVDVDILPAAERDLVVADWNDTSRPSRQASVVDLFEEVVAAQPGAPAVLHGAEVLSYAELDRRAGSLARHLRERGVGRGDRVAVALDRTPRLVVALLGVLKAGGSYVPIDPDATSERTAQIVDDSRCVLTLTDATFPEPTEDPHRSAAAAPDPRAAPTLPGEVAYLIYTSGSTGRPKGVLVTHGGVVNLTLDLADRMSLGPGEVVAAVAPHSFDMSVPELIGPLLTGAALRLVSRDHARDAGALASALADVTFAQLTPSHWQLLLDDGWSDPRLRAGCGAEAFPPALAVRLQAAVGELWNLYGPTETTVWSTVAALTDRADPATAVPIGRPLANTFATVLDDRLRPAPVGVPGELYLGGAGLALGYDRLAGMTATRFVPDPFHPGARLYRTGDIVRWRRDGQLEFQARADHQVKVRGFRVELTDVEIALERHPDVTRAAVVARGEGVTRTLVGFVVLRPGGDVDDVRRSVGERLPSYMVPSVLSTIDEIPLSPNGKLDRRRLPEEVPSRPARDVTPPRDDTESTVAAAYTEVLGIDEVDVHDDFFTIGGHSLNAAHVIARLRTSLHRDITVRQLFDHPTVAGLASAAASAPPLADTATHGPTLADDPEDKPLSAAQQRLWILDQLSPGRTDYNVQRVIRLRGALDTDSLARALHDVAGRHEVLRCAFPVRDGRPVVDASADPPVLLVGEVARAGAADPLEPALALARDDIDAPFDLARGPLWRARVITLGDQDHLLVLVFHHIVVDGGSFPTLWRDLATAYAGDPLPPAPMQYVDHARAERATPVDRASSEYWRAQLRDMAATELPLDRPRPRQRSGRGAELAFVYGSDVADRLREVARATGRTFYAVGLAAFAVVVARFGNSAEVVVGTPVSGRDDPALQEVVGCFVNTLVLRLRCPRGTTFRELLGQVHVTVSDGYAHRSVPFEQLVDDLQPVRDLGRNPLFDIMFAVPDPESVDLAGLAAEPVGTTASSAKFDLSMELAPDGTGTVVYDDALFDRETVEGLTAVLAEVLADVPSALDVPVAALAPTEAPPVDVPGGEPVDALPGRVLRHLQADPGRVAVRQGSVRTTGGELAAAVTSAAAWLRGHGVGRGDVVALDLAIGVDLMALMLAVGSCGAAFLVTDPADAPARRRELAARAGARVTVDALPPASSAADEPVVPAPVGHADLAAVYFTSGSTGSPKAVLETVGGVARYFGFLAELLSPGSPHVVLQVAPPTFDASMRDMFGALVAGGSTVLLEPGQRRDPYEVVAAIRRFAVTALIAVVPSMVRALVTASRGSTVDLTVIAVSGEALDGQLARDIAAWAPRARLVNLYGPTECTMTSTSHVVTDQDVGTGVVPVGRPIPGARAFVVDAGGRLLPSGALGELWVSGEGVARGYDSAGQTAARFVPDPFDPSGGRAYRTGDLVHRRHDGRLIYHGRDDEQFKLHGVRVEPAEVEAVLVTCPGVEAAAVAPRGGALVAYLVGDWDAAVVRGRVTAALPTLLHPDRLVRLDELPRNRNGKVDRAQLPAPDAEPGGVSRQPRDVAELAMLRTWERVLGVGRLGVQDDFFHVGGNSLRAVDLIEALRVDLGVSVPLHMLFTEPTVEKLCAALAGWTPHDGLLVPLRGSRGSPAAATSTGTTAPAAGDTTAPLFLVHAQSGEVCSYLDLAMALDIDRPVVGVEAVGYDSDEPPLDRVELMAERYLAEVRSHQPHGPYHLAGWSFGGNVAFEMARRLEEAGERVAFLGLIDARAFGEDDQEDWYLAKSDYARFGLVAGLDADEADALTDLDEHRVLTMLLRHGRQRSTVSDRADSQTMRRMIAVFTANGRAADAYRPTGSIVADVHLFRATEQHPSLTNPVVDPSAWRRRTRGRLLDHPVPGTHHDLLSGSHAEQFARVFADALPTTVGSS